MINTIEFQHMFFDSYLGLFLQVIPFVILATVLYGVLKFRKDRTTPAFTKVFASLFVGYVAGAVLLLAAIDVLADFWYFVLYHGPSGRGIHIFPLNYNFKLETIKRIDKHFFGNLFLFLPFGLLLPFFKPGTGFWKTVLWGLIGTVTIEVVQPFLGRCGDINDVILNFAGCAVSALLYQLIRIIAKPRH